MLLLALILLIVVLATSPASDRSTITFNNPIKLTVLSLLLAIGLVINCISSSPLDLLFVFKFVVSFLEYIKDNGN